ncbi:fimbrial biogenesis chaperone [Erwinia psidii]|uniref:Molecular chaperone n=1 Tax=Erwinia psidii TaxID=69224 RepID=A0A3N6RZS7_9GAMM|nr:fimbria/pilus periplasmic chaperone [Erwinia psidii]MCX8958286.1 molecular chaperone [Erwinia psidii]MCX8962427.1 molecular chaperone [Erwinia psidii]MCX8965212.1 molecular chaperone [Erwinia psidii]RQM37987.1 molecular chaperone [Erwinia psidii]
MLKTITLLLAIIYPATSFSAIQIMATRVILNAKENEQSFIIKNTGDTPSLLQLWLADKNDDSVEIKSNVPFTITPPVSRVNAQRNKVFRILSVDDAAQSLPQDRESVFWINVLDVPSTKAESEEGNKLNIAFRTRIKLFYRPVSLKGTPEDSATRLVWSERKSGGDYIYKVTNNEPYHVSFANLSLKAGDKNVATIPGGMVEPYSSKEFVFKGVNNSNVEMSYRYITDLGAFVTGYYKK